MILDTSVLVAVILREPGFGDLSRKVFEAPVRAIGAPSAAEAAIVLDVKLGPPRGRQSLSQLLHEWDVMIVPFNDDHWKEAAHAYARFGRGRHKAALNFGDCLTYAVARLADEPLLCVGDGFRKTDLRLA